jgi:hypothetical protein
MGMASREVSSSDSSSEVAANKFCLFEATFDLSDSEVMCLIKAVEAFKVFMVGLVF